LHGASHQKGELEIRLPQAAFALHHLRLGVSRVRGGARDVVRGGQARLGARSRIRLVGVRAIEPFLRGAHEHFRRERDEVAPRDVEPEHAAIVS
jgi:hypothetical protein